MLLRRPSSAVLLAATLGAGLPACLLDASAYDGAPEATGGSGGGSTTTGAGASSTGAGASTTGTAGTAGSTASGGSGGTITAGGTGGGGTAGTGGSSPPVDGDACPGKPVSIVVYSEVLVDGDTGPAHDDYGSSVCGGGSAPDLVYEVTPKSKGLLTAFLEPDVDYDGFVHLRTKCTDPTTEVDCGTSKTIPVEADTPVYVFVDGHTTDPNKASSGKFNLHLSLDGCGNGTLEPEKEECDDGNLFNDDQCDALCKVRCTAEGSITSKSDTFIHPTTHHCYLQSYDPNSDWTTAMNDCIAWGGTLAALTTTNEISDLSNLLSKNGDTCWLGGDDSMTDGTFVWLTGEPWMYTNGDPPWDQHFAAPDEPNGGTNENCVEIYGNGNLNDNNCGSQENWLCERPPAGGL